MRRFWILPVLGLIAILAIGCSQANEVLPSGSAAPSITSTVGPSGSPFASPTISAPAGTQTATGSPIATAGWLIYAHPTEGFSFSYPPDWSLQEYSTDTKVRIASFNLDTWNTPSYPDGGILIDIGRVTSHEGPRPSDAVDSPVGTLFGWMRHLPGGDEAVYAKSVVYSADSGGFTYIISAAFDQIDTDESVVQTIADTLIVSN
jgi:hypothetical protein